VRWPNFCGPTFLRSQSLLASPERCMNLYPQRVGQKYVLYDTPGLTEFVSAPETPGRGIFSQSLGQMERAFATIGTKIYEFFADGTKTSRGTVATDQNPATMTTNGDGGNELLITSGAEGYVLDLTTNVLTNPVSDVTFGGMIDGFFVALDSVTSTLKISDLLDGQTWDPTQIAQRSTAPDPWRAMLVKYPRIWLLGEHTGDVWYNAGTAPFPFAPIAGVQIPYGIAAPFSLTTVGPAIMWLTRNQNGVGQVVEALGYAPTVVSTEPIDWVISQFDAISDAVAYSYQDQGHEFYVLNFPSANRTLVYDRTEGLWHERGSWDATAGRFNEWGPQFHTYAFGRHLVLHSTNGSIYDQNINVFTDADGALISRLRIPPVLAHDNKRMSVARLELLVEPGLGLTTGQGIDPQVVMALSGNGGKTWGNERSRSMGVQGAYDQRLQWFNCGSGRYCVPQFSATAPVPTRWLDLIADVRQGAA
jgi:hypothetical protein